jgi:hypothetical protein
MSFPPELLVGLAGGRSGGLIACLPQAGIFYIKKVYNFLLYLFLKRCGYTVVLSADRFKGQSLNRYLEVDYGVFDIGNFGHVIGRILPTAYCCWMLGTGEV